MTSLKKLFPFPGGLRLVGSQLNKRDVGSVATKVTTTESITETVTSDVTSAVIQAKIPQRLIFPLQQRYGATTLPVVNVGDHVLKGQEIAKASDPLSVPIHASSSGKITAIRELPTADPSGINTTCIEMETDGRDQWVSQRKITNENYMQLSPLELRQRIHNAGIVGMGGAGFPSAVKLDAGQKNNIDILILNGAECEPYVSCDDMLMRTRANEIIAGTQIIMRTLQTGYCIIAIEDNKPEAVAALNASLEASFKTSFNTSFNTSHNKDSSPKIDIITVPTLYPVGGEKQLIKLLTNRGIAKNRHPYEYGLACYNVATAAATYRAIYFNEPLLSRIVTVTGAVPQTQNLDVLIGTTVGALIENCGGRIQSLNQIIMGGPMMGIALHSSETPVEKTTICIIAKSNTVEFKHAAPFPARAHARPCIRCGACADACPVKLLPQQLFWHAHAKEIEKTKDYHIQDCIECGCCDYVCPSHIPLVAYFRYAKAEIHALEQDKIKSNLARQRHEFRAQRLEREKKERAERHKKKIDELSKKLPATETPKEKKNTTSANV
ncbi:MAG: electron transport complex subunit RsxC [Gammaproteobacteria bacterium]|nr:electron transport complex subunit RsxC [Gammaproteobacteria bacterium]